MFVSFVNTLIKPIMKPLHGKFVSKASIRWLSIGSVQLVADKALLSKLRKKTGIGLSHCRDALIKYENDYEKAKEWLLQEAQSRGLEKATKLESRPVMQGLVGFYVNGNNGVLVEVNCETDFVARNNEFQQLVNTLTREILQVSKTQSDLFSKRDYSQTDLESLSTCDGNSLKDIVALTVGRLGENIRMIRATQVSVGDGVELIGYAHPSLPQEEKTSGRLATLVGMKNPKKDEETARELCTHIIALNPKRITCPEEDKSSIREEERTLIYQEFINEKELTVGNVLEDTNIEVVDFVRYERGETNVGS